jgi:long-subunit acyl-CoA synthetase (AMP-forming)
MSAEKSKQSVPKLSKRTFPEIVHEIAKRTPNRPYASIPISAEVTDGFRDVSFGDIANGVNNFAFQLEKLYGRSEEFETITYVGVNDLRYVMVFLGAIKCGYKAS